MQLHKPEALGLPDPSAELPDTFLYLHLIDNDIGEEDDLLGEAKVNISDWVKPFTKAAAEMTVPLTVCTHAVTRTGFKTLPTAVSGNVTFKIEAQETTGAQAGASKVSITLIRGEDLKVSTAITGAPARRGHI